jgi:two-component system response regulator AlgR
VKILVVDDEALARERLLRLLGRLRPGARCLEAADGEQALTLVNGENPDLLLLDIRMPGLDGIEVATRLDAMASPPAIIFCTAYDEYALQALQHQAVAYLLKPVREAELTRALAAAGRVNRLQLASLREQAPGVDSSGAGASGVETSGVETSGVETSGVETSAARGRSRVSSQTHRGLETMPVAEIRCFVAEQKYVTACSPGRELLIPDTLKDLEREFAGRFLRVHRNALVAREHIERLARDDSGVWHVVLHGIEVRPAVSRRHLAQAKQQLLER